MLTPEDKAYIDEAVATRMDIMSAFRDLPEAFKEEIAADIGAYVDQRQRALRKPENTYTPRWTVDMADINEDDAGVEKGHTGPTLPRWVDIIGGTAHLDGDDPQILHFRAGGGGADCMFDYLVSSCWATEVAAGRGVEGQTMTSLTGCTFKVYSTVAAPLADAAAGTKASVAIAVCRGTYAESDIAWPTESGTLKQIEIIGGGATPTDAGWTNAVIIGATTGNVFNITGNPCAMSLRNLVVDGAKAINFVSGINLRTQWEQVRFTGTIDTNAFLQLRADRCWFDSALASEAGGTEESLVFSGCIFTSTVDFSASTGAVEIIFDAGCRHVNAGTGLANVTVGDFRTFVHHGVLTGPSKIIIAGGTGLGKDFDIQSTFMTAPVTTDCNIAITTGGGQTETFNGRIAANFTAPTSAVAATTAFIKLTGTSGDKIFGISVVGSVFGSGTSAGSYIEDRGGFSIIADHINNCTFGPNAPAGKALYNVTNATMTKVDGVLFSAGAPAHTDNYGAFYKDTATDTIYTQQADPTGSTWAVVGVSGGGAGAPSPHNLVSTHHDGEQDYTSALYLGELRLGVNGTTGDLTWYSDAGTTVVATVDGATGHAVFGSTTAPSSVIVVNAGKSGSDLATMQAVSAGITNTLTAGSSAALTAFNTSISVTGAQTATGIHSGTKTQVTAQGSSIVNDMRNFYALATMASSGRIVSRYGLYVADATGISSGAMTNQYGVYIENMAKGDTINRPIYSLGGASRHVGSFAFGADIAPASAVDVRGALTTDGMAAPATPATDDIVVYNETGTDILKAKEDNGAVYALTHEHVVGAYYDWATASTTVPAAIAPPMARAGTIVGVVSKAGENKTIGATAWVGDIHLIPAANINTDGQGTSIFTTKPTVTNGNMAQNYGAPDLTTTFAAGDVLAFYTDTAGTNATFGSVGVKVRYT